jgi:hypothetical protein
MYRITASLLVLLVCLVAETVGSRPVLALDYETNDLSTRELAIGGMIATADTDPAVKTKCGPDGTQTCENIVQPFGIFVRGAARRHRRYFYLGSEVQVGVLLPQSGQTARPWLMWAGVFGGETSPSGYTRLRGYGEAGMGMAFANTKIGDTLQVFAEGGMRYRLQTHTRPHLIAHAGLRVTTNLGLTGMQAQVGLGWAFD